MATDEYRATVSVVFWTASSAEAQSEIAALKTALPAEDQDNVLSTIEFVPGGKPSTEPKPQENPPDMSGPPEEPEAG